MPLRDPADGLTADEIAGKIAANNVSQDEKWAVRMAELEKNLNHRLDQHEEKVDARFGQTEERIDERFGQTEDRLEQSIRRTKDELMFVLKSQGEQQRSWQKTQEQIQTGYHKSDLEFRKSIHERLDTQDVAIAAGAELAQEAVDSAKSIQEVQDAMSTRLSIISWLVTISKGLKTTFDGTVAAAERSKKISHTITAICSMLTVLWVFFHSWLPALKKIFEHHH